MPKRFIGARSDTRFWGMIGAIYATTPMAMVARGITTFIHVSSAG